MATHVAFLRAINLGATRKFPKDAIVAAAQGAGFADVATYINTGNLRISTAMRSRARIEEALERAFLADRGFEVPTIVFGQAELREVVADAERLAEGHTGRHFVSLLKQEPTPEAVRALEERSTAEEVARVSGRAVHILLGESYHEARLTNAVVERILGVATARTLPVIQTITDRWCSPASR